MKIFISVISHHHEKIISNLGCLAILAECGQFEIIIKSNTILETNFSLLFCGKQNVHLLDESYGLGFGENNNFVFQWCIDKLAMSDDDWFLVLNPDVLVDVTSLVDLVKRTIKERNELSTINLYKDDKYTVYDNCVRKFPTLIDFISSYVGLGNKTIYDKSIIQKERKVDWAAGSFLLFKASLYRELGGFDKGYFMYCEDIDICWRANKLKSEQLTFYPDIRAIHYAEHANRSFFSKHFVWHVKSMIRYLLMTYKVCKPYQKD